MVRVISFLLLLIGCSNPKGFESLSGEGVLPVSTTNAFLGSNLFLSQEFEKSSYLRNFFQARGAPHAIEIKDGRNMLFFYPKDREYYEASLVSSEVDYQWITRGPFPMDRKIFLKVSHLANEASDPIFYSRGKTFRFIEPTPTPRPLPPPPTARPKPALKKPSLPPAEKAPPVPTQIVVPPTPTPELKAFSFDQVAIEMSQGFAERNADNDVIHTVERDGETIEEITAWYTGSKENSDAVSTANGILKDAPLITGARIRVPANLVKERKRKP
jgi:hypothetical protein